MSKIFGRRANNEIDKVHAQAWFCVISARMWHASAYAIEKYYKTNQDDFSGDFIYTKQFKHYEKGRYLPRHEIVEWFENREDINFKGTQKIFDNLFWLLLKESRISPNKLYGLLEELPIPVAAAVQSPNDARRFFSELSSFDGLAGCQFLLCEASNNLIRDADSILFNFLVMLQIISRLGAYRDYRSIALPLFNLIRNQCLEFLRPYVNETRETIQLIENLEIEKMIRYRVIILRIIDEMSIFNKLRLAPPSCLYLAEKYITTTILNELSPMIRNNDISKIKSHSSIQKLKRSLRRWEKIALRRNLVH